MSTERSGAERRPTSSPSSRSSPSRTRRAGREVRDIKTSAYPHWFYLPAAMIFGVIFVIPTMLSFYYSRLAGPCSTRSSSGSITSSSSSANQR